MRVAFFLTELFCDQFLDASSFDIDVDYTNDNNFDFAFISIFTFKRPTTVE